MDNQYQKNKKITNLISSQSMINYLPNFCLYENFFKLKISFIIGFSLLYTKKKEKKNKMSAKKYMKTNIVNDHSYSCSLIMYNKTRFYEDAWKEWKKKQNSMLRFLIYIWRNINLYIQIAQQKPNFIDEI